MKEYILLGIVALLPVVFSIVLYLVDKYTQFGKLNNTIKQIIYGVVFGLLAVVGTECGVPMNGAQVNCRDAAVLVGGLLFGAPAGIIAGLIGGIERWFAVYWGIGTFTRVACSVSTIIAGIYSALLRKLMFEDKKPSSWLLAMAIGVVMEVFHLTMVFITNMAEVEQAMAVVKACTVPMVVANGVSVMLSAMALSIIGRERVVKKQSKVRISQTIQRWLLVTVVIAFFATSYFVYSFQDAIATAQTDSLLTLALDEVSADIDDMVDDGIVVSENITDLTKNRSVGNTGYILIADKDGKLLSAHSGLTQSKLESDFQGITPPEQNVSFVVTINDTVSYAMYRMQDDYYIMSVLPEAEALQLRNIALYVNTFMEILVFAILFAMVYLLIKRVVVNQIKSINSSLSKITEGNLDVTVDVRTNEEFASLSDDINSTVGTLKNYIAEASARIDKELEFAKNIQTSALPSVFPAFPKHKDFDIYALMNPAKEVGGDFYDFYITHEDYLNFLIADVSGKGIPAAMFMMRAKTELKSLTEADMDLNEVFTHGNTALCEGNDAGMFVTAWQGSLALSSGLLTYVNAGHNPPLVKHANGKFEYLRSKAGFVLAGMDNLIYKENQLQLEAGDVVYLYTDGVTEATNADNVLFGEQRLLDTLNNADCSTAESICSAVKNAVNEFVGTSPQFDDITMVALCYKGKADVTKIHFDNASLDDIPEVTEFVENQLNKVDCPLKAITQINVAVDEIYSNIVRYGYAGKKGPVTVSLILKDKPHRCVYVRFADEGVPYNPLTKEDPDVTLSAEDRQIGGLGIFMVKKTMDDVRYKYEDNQNIFTIRKDF